MFRRCTVGERWSRACCELRALALHILATAKVCARSAWQYCQPGISRQSPRARLILGLSLIRQQQITDVSWTHLICHGCADSQLPALVLGPVVFNRWEIAMLDLRVALIGVRQQRVPRLAKVFDPASLTYPMRH